MQSFTDDNAQARKPVFLPVPHEVVAAFITAFATLSCRAGDPGLHESLLHSMKIIFLGFFLPSLIGQPLGILCGRFGRSQVRIEPGWFGWNKYQQFLSQNRCSVERFRTQQPQAFAEERHRWAAAGVIAALVRR